MATIDISAIEAAMKMQQLDTLRGYAQNDQTTVQQEQNTEYVARESATGYQLLREPLWNKGMQGNLTYNFFTH